MKPVDVTYIVDSTYIDFDIGSNDKDRKSKVLDYVRIVKYKNYFSKRLRSIWSKEIFVIKNVKYTVTWTYVIEDFNDKEILGTFYQKELQKTSIKRVENGINRKGDKLYVNWKSYGSYFYSWIDKEDIVI